MEMMKKVFICSDTVTGIFSAIYDAWKLMPQPGEAGIALRGRVEQELFCDYIEVEENAKKAASVEKLIKKHLGNEAYGNLYQAMLSYDERKGDAVLGTMLEAKRIPDSRKIMNHLAAPCVRKVFELSRAVGNEAHFHKEFIRFRELENGVLFAKINPKAQVLVCIADHFYNRLPLENWLIYDETHKAALVRRVGKRWVLVVGEEIDMRQAQRISQTEQMYEKLWRGFCKTISIKERENKQLQRQNMPLWYRVNMVECMEMCYTDKG